MKYYPAHHVEATRKQHQLQQHDKTTNAARGTFRQDFDHALGKFDEDDASEWKSTPEKSIYELEARIIGNGTTGKSRHNDGRKMTESKRSRSQRGGFNLKRIGSASYVFKSLRKTFSGRKMNNSNNNEKKRVRFLDETTESHDSCEAAAITTVPAPLCSYFGGDDRPFPIDGSSKNVNPIWFCATEFKLFQKEAIRDISRDGGDSLCKKQYKALYALCQSAEGTASVVLRQSAALCSSRHRGLETFLFPNDVLRKHAVRGVLNLQAQLRAQQQKDTTGNSSQHSDRSSSCGTVETANATVMNSTPTAEQAASMELSLAVLSRSKTLAARRMARVLAAGDEYVAREGAPLAMWNDVEVSVTFHLVEI